MKLSLLSILLILAMAMSCPAFAGTATAETTTAGTKTGKTATGKTATTGTTTARTATGKSATGKTATGKTATGNTASAVIATKDYPGWEIHQKNMFLGLIIMRVCPVGVKFNTPLINGCVFDDGKDLRVTIVNDERKIYRNFTIEQFKTRMQLTTGPVLGGTKQPGWKSIMKGTEPGPEMFGFKTIKCNYALKMLQPPYVEFPDKMYVAPDLCPSTKVLQFLRAVFQLPADYKNVGFPMRIEETVTLSPLRRRIAHKTESVEHKTIKAADLNPPKGYKVADAESEVFSFGSD